MDFTILLSAADHLPMGFGLDRLRILSFLIGKNMKITACIL